MSSGIITANRLGFTYMKNRNTYVKPTNTVKFVVHISLGNWVVSVAKNGDDLHPLAANFKSAETAMRWQAHLVDRDTYG